MAVSELTQVLRDCESQLGWSCASPRIRNVHHKILAKALEKNGFTPRDLRLAISYAKQHRLLIKDPLQLIPLVYRAREVAAEKPKPLTDLAELIQSAVAWEYGCDDAATEYWLGRLARSAGTGRKTALAEWRQAGRGGSHAGQ